MKVRAHLATMALAALAACSGGGEERTAVASLYPLAFVTERVAGPGWEVVDLTPPGAEAHDVEVSLEDRAHIERAEVLVYLGDIGFQPQVERAAADATGEVVAVSERVPLLEGSDPHVWFALEEDYPRIVDLVRDALSSVDPQGEERYRRRAERLKDDLLSLSRRYRQGLGECRFRTAVVSHEAFGYLLEAHGVQQFGIAGLSPESEPTTERLAQAQALIDQGQAGAVFYEPTGEARRIAESVAADTGVPAVPLSTLESRPEAGDFMTTMESNLTSLREGLGCR